MTPETQSLKEVIQKTSIVLGYDTVDYTSTSGATLKHKKGSGLTSADLEMFQQVKKDLRATHYNFGDQELTYSTSNKLLDPTGNMGKYTAKLNVEAKAMLRSTSATLGYDDTSYNTSTSDATQWNKNSMIKSIEAREKTKKIADPRKVNFNFGSEKTNYLSSGKEAFTYDASKVVPATMADAVKADLRKCHYTLGNDNLNYSTSNAMRDMSEADTKNAKGTIDEASNPWRVNVNLKYDI